MYIFIHRIHPYIFIKLMVRIVREQIAGRAVVELKNDNERLRSV